MPTQCNRLFGATGTATAVAKDCDIRGIKFEKDLLNKAKAKAMANAKTKCPKKCPIVQFRKAVSYNRLCVDGKITVTFAGIYVCGE